MLYRCGRRAGVQRDTGLGTGTADRLQRAVDVGACFDMGRDHIGTGFGKGIDVGIHGCDHQMHVHHALDMGADRGAGGRAKADVRDEMPVHYIDMYPVRTLRFDGFALCPEIGKVGSKDGGGDFDRTVEGHGIGPFVKGRGLMQR